MFLRLHDLVLDARDDLMDLIQAENGKARRDAFLEVGDIAITCRYYARTARQGAGADGALRADPRAHLGPGAAPPQGHRHRHLAVELPAQPGAPATPIPALLAGNAVLQKADNQTALTALFALDLARRAGAARRPVADRARPRAATSATTLLDAADYVMFTGSTESGRDIAQEAGRRLIDCSLELGGKNAMLVLDDADLDRAVEGAVRACFSSSGQLCISIERMYVADCVHDAFVPRFLAAVEAMQHGRRLRLQLPDGLADLHRAARGRATPRRGRRGRRRHRARRRHVPRPDLGPFFFEPTVLTDVAAGDDLLRRGDLRPASCPSTASPPTTRPSSWPTRTRYGLNASVWSRSARAGASRGRPAAGRHGQRQRGLRRRVGQHRRPDGRHGRLGHGPPPRRARASSSTPRPRPSPASACSTWPRRCRSSATTGFAAVMTTALRLMKKVGWR